MRTLDKKAIDTIFQDLSNNISPEYKKIIHSLDNIKPSRHESETQEWRYRLSGYIEALSSINILETGIYDKVIFTLFADQINNGTKRPGRVYKYSVEVLTDQNKIFNFDVPSMNPTDAYLQLTKRISYKSIPGIELVRVFSGVHSGRSVGAKPLKQFTKNELIYVTLL